MCIICSIYGIYSIDIAVTGMSEGGWDMSAPSKYIAVQTFSLFLGIAGFVLFTVIDADILGQQWKILCAINVLLLVALVIFGQDDGTGNKSWIRFAGIGIQPSEVIKVLYIVVAAKQMTYLKEYRDINSFLSVVQMAAHFGIVFLMIVGVSSDLGSAGILLGVFLVMFYALGVKLYWFAIGGALVASAIPLLWNYFLKDYQKQRLVAPYDASVDPDGWGIRWQTTQSKMSLASGRLTGAEHKIGVRMEHAVDDALCDLGTGRGKAGEVDIIGGPADEYCDDEDYRRVQQPLARAVRVHFRDGELAVESLFEHFYLVFLTHCASPFSSASCEDIR